MQFCKRKSDGSHQNTQFYIIEMIRLSFYLSFFIFKLNKVK